MISVNAVPLNYALHFYMYMQFWIFTTSNKFRSHNILSINPEIKKYRNFNDYKTLDKNRLEETGTLHFRNFAIARSRFTIGKLNAKLTLLLPKQCYSKT